MDILIQTLIVGGIGLACAAVLTVAAWFLAVHEDPRLETVTASLPGINCGGCGFAGCAEYARAIVRQGLPINLCAPGGAQTLAKLESIMGLTAGKSERRVALVLCKGDNGAARRSALYNGLCDCSAAQQIGGNGKACRYGCMGLGSCARVCPVDAIELRDGLAIVHPDICIGCGRCVPTCPRRLIKLIPETRFIHVLCSSRDRGPDVRTVCSVGCIACTLCVKTVNGQGISMQDNLATVDYAVPLTNDEVVAKCPTHTIERRPGTIGGTP